MPSALTIKVSYSGTVEACLSDFPDEAIRAEAIRRGLIGALGSVQINLAPAEWRQRAGLSQAQAAALVGVRGSNPARTWQRWEAGEARPPYWAVAAVERVSGGMVTSASWMAVRALTDQDHPLVARAIQQLGSEMKLARACGVSQNCIWVAKVRRRVSSNLAIAIERATNGQVARWQLRPDLWEPPKPDPSPPAPHVFPEPFPVTCQ